MPQIETRFRDRDDRYWRQWALRALLVLGAAHLLSGVVFFFAYNWQDLGPLARFAVLQLALILAVAAALLAGIDRPAGRALLVAATVLTGVLLAVIGQIYQTGADAWELFAAWSLVVLPWVFGSRSSVHWLVWAAIAMIALSLYGAQVMIPLGVLPARHFTVLLGIVPIVLLALREWAVGAGCGWLDERWQRVILVLAGLAILFRPAVAFVFDGSDLVIGFAAFVLAAGALGYVYARTLPDFAVVAVVTGFVALLGMAAGGRVVVEIVGTDSGPGSLVVGLILLLLWCGFVTASTVRLLKLANRRMGRDETND